ncbi:lipase/ esterase [Russula emetica]|nr:lipase/ esterase [Russula emetica]
MPNTLISRVGLTVGPLFLETLVKHYFARVIKDSSKSGVPLRSEELLYDEAFNIVKDFLNVSTRHTVEELQSFSNVRTPSPPWVHVVRLVIPMASCDEAAVYLIKAFRGEQVMKRVVGGTKWWQVRGVRGLDAEWISAKKDWQDERRHAKEQTRRKHPTEGLGLRDSGLEDITFSSEGEESHEPASASAPAPASSDDEPSRDSGSYQPEMDEMRCVLYAHGGGYYFGSVDQERYSIQRFARKIRGRVLAVNYRLAPQYPFPCAIQDLLAAYLFLIRPPEGAAHRPVRPERIIIAGDSAGGGLSLALLQIIRDSGLPAPAGGVLISPWCDFTHSFPSIFTNTDTDVVPVTGLSLHKPSPLWPPPPYYISDKVHNGLRKNITDVLHRRSRNGPSRTPQAARPIGSDNEVPNSETLPAEPGFVGAASTASLPVFLDADQTTGETIEVTQQIQLYAPNGLLKHPLVSPALSYLGGLPPLLFIAGDREVLRDEIIYAAHRAAHPERFPLREEMKKMYPAFKLVETSMQPTPVHLQVYDDVAHVLPILFPFTTPGKYCYRAMASFVGHVTNPPQVPLRPTRILTPSRINSTTDHGISASPVSLTPHGEIQSPGASSRPNLRRSLTSGISRAASNIKRRSSLLSPLPVRKTRGLAVLTPNDTSPSTSGYVTPQGENLSEESFDAVGPGIGRRSDDQASAVRTSMAGEANVYARNWATSPSQRHMIRERVSTRGLIRPLEAETDLPAMQVPSDHIGTLPERAIERYVKAKERSDKKFAQAIKRIEKQRLRNIDRASRDMNQHIAALQHYLDRESHATAAASSLRGTGTDRMTRTTSYWNMAWALDEDERPPPSSIVARRDTEEALKLARIADKAVLASERTLSANNLWNVIISFLMASPEERKKERRTPSLPGHSPKLKGKGTTHLVGAGRKTSLRSFLGRRRRSETGGGESIDITSGSSADT